MAALADVAAAMEVDQRRLVIHTMWTLLSPRPSTLLLLQAVLLGGRVDGMTPHCMRDGTAVEGARREEEEEESKRDGR